MAGTQTDAFASVVMVQDAGGAPLKDAFANLYAEEAAGFVWRSTFRIDEDGKYILYNPDARRDETLGCSRFMYTQVANAKGPLKLWATCTFEPLPKTDIVKAGRRAYAIDPGKQAPDTGFVTLRVKETLQSVRLEEERVGPVKNAWAHVRADNEPRGASPRWVRNYRVDYAGRYLRQSDNWKDVDAPEPAMRIPVRDATGDLKVTVLCTTDVPPKVAAALVPPTERDPLARAARDDGTCANDRHRVEGADWVVPVVVKGASGCKAEIEFEDIDLRKPSPEGIICFVATPDRVWNYGFSTGGWSELAKAIEKTAASRRESRGYWKGKGWKSVAGMKNLLGAIDKPKQKRSFEGFDTGFSFSVGWSTGTRIEPAPVARVKAECGKPHRVLMSGTATDKGELPLAWTGTGKKDASCRPSEYRIEAYNCDGRTTRALARVYPADLFLLQFDFEAAKDLNEAFKKAVNKVLGLLAEVLGIEAEASWGFGGGFMIASGWLEDSERGREWMAYHSLFVGPEGYVKGGLKVSVNLVALALEGVAAVPPIVTEKFLRLELGVGLEGTLKSSGGLELRHYCNTPTRTDVNIRMLRLQPSIVLELGAGLYVGCDGVIGAGIFVEARAGIFAEFQVRAELAVAKAVKLDAAVGMEPVEVEVKAKESILIFHPEQQIAKWELLPRRTWAKTQFDWVFSS